MPARGREGWIDWRTSQAKQVLLNDLFNLTLPVDENEVSTEQAWEHYRHHPAFVGPPVVYEQFAERLRDHRAQIGGRIERAQWEMAAMSHDRLVNPYPTHNHRGEPNFHGSAAKPLLRQDIVAGLHEQMTPAAFRETRQEYMVFTTRKFTDLIKQMVRLLKTENWVRAQGGRRGRDNW